MDLLPGGNAARHEVAELRRPDAVVHGLLLLDGGCVVLEYVVLRLRDFARCPKG
jgi:hypothetical protein